MLPIVPYLNSLSPIVKGIRKAHEKTESRPETALGEGINKLLTST